MSLEYRFEPPTTNDFITFEEEVESIDDEPVDFDDEFQDQVEEYLTNERHQMWRIQEIYERSDY